MIFVRCTDLDRVELRAAAPSSRWEGDGLTVVADADIDNLAALRESGLALDDAASAAEMVGRAYARWGSDAARHLLGDFAFVVWDADRRALYCARDQLGIRALYHRHRRGELVLGSVAREVAGSACRPSLLGISLYLVGEHDEDGFTLYDDVNALRPGHQLLHRRRTPLRETRYWSPRRDRELGRESDEAVERLFTTTFREAVGCRMRSGPIGVEVSGGLDSSAVAGQAAALCGAAPPTALNLAFPGMDCDETRFSDAVANRWKLPLVRHDARATAVGQTDDDHPDLIFDPTLSSFGPLVSKAAERGIRVVLTGVGGDQTMDESGTECADALREWRFADAARVAGITRRPFSRRSYSRLFSWGLRPLTPEPLRRVARSWRARPTLEPLTERASTRALEHLYARMRAAANNSDERRGMCRELASHHLLMPVQQSHRLGARHGIRFRHPFLDLRVVELMLSAPPRLRLRDGVLKGKPLLRRALRDYLPRAVVERTDAGEFSGYLRYVLLDHNRQQTRDLFQDSRLADLGILDPHAMRAVLDGETQTHINRLTLATGMELWLRRTFT